MASSSHSKRSFLYASSRQPAGGGGGRRQLSRRHSPSAESEFLPSGLFSFPPSLFARLVAAVQKGGGGERAARAVRVAWHCSVDENRGNMARGGNMNRAKILKQTIMKK